MSEFFQAPSTQAVVWTTALAALLVLGAYLIGKVRTMRQEEPPGASELLSSFRDLHGKGQLTDEEYRTIKGVLTEQLQQQWMSSGDKG